jgi:isoquinoline 1-oxidoreductase alpha subunit
MELIVPNHTFILNGKRVNVDCDGNVRLLWVLRDLLGVTGPKYGCGLHVCRACTSHINGKAFNPCAVPVSQIKRDDKIVTIEGLPATVGKPLHPMQEAWIEFDVGQCGYCQPGQIMTAVAMVEDLRAKGRKITDAELDEIRNVCRCGTYTRIREAIRAGAANMPAAKPNHKPKPAHKHKKKKPVKHHPAHGKKTPTREDHVKTPTA